MEDDPMIVSLRKPQESGATPGHGRDPSLVVSLKMPQRPVPSPDAEPVRMARRADTSRPLSIRAVTAPTPMVSLVHPVAEQGAPPEPRASVVTRRKPRRTPKFIYLLAGAVFVALVIGGYFTFYAGRLASADPAQASALEVNQLVSRVGALMVLPQGETPTVATVSDLNALKGQTFFANAVVGDKVLMYPKAGQAILYDPVANKIVQSGPLTVGTQ